MPPRRLSRRSSRVDWTTATHCCMASATDYLNASSRCRTLPPAWSQAPVGETTSSASVSSDFTALCKSYFVIYYYHTSVKAAALAASPSASRVQDRGARASVARWSCSCVLGCVVFCRTLVVAHCGPIQMTCGSCSFR